jgi:hypothetical protein
MDCSFCRKLNLDVLNWAPCSGDILEGGSIHPHILHIGTTWRFMVSFMTQGHCLHYLLHRPGGPQNQLRCCGGQKNFIPLSATELLTPQSSSPKPSYENLLLNCMQHCNSTGIQILRQKIYAAKTFNHYCTDHCVSDSQWLLAKTSSVITVFLFIWTFCIFWQRQDPI